jgi:hypothetical protein
VTRQDGQLRVDEFNFAEKTESRLWRLPEQLRQPAARRSRAGVAKNVAASCTGNVYRASSAA